jgi:signal transduction histidine kinase
METRSDLESERFREILLDLERALGKERESRVETEAVLSGLSALADSKNKSGAFVDLLHVLKGLIGFEDAFILERHDDGKLRVVASTAAKSTGAVWIGGGLLSRLASGRPIAFFDTESVQEWRDQPEGIRAGARSALHVFLRDRPRPAVFVCTHSRRGFFTQAHIRLSTRFAPLAAQALINFDYTRELECINEKLRLEIVEREKVEAELQGSYARLNAAKAQLIQSEKMSAVGQLAAGVAHELNNPLGVILGFAQSLNRKIGDGDALALPLRSIARESLRCKELVQNLLTFSRRDRENLEPLELAEAVSGALLLVETQARIRGVELRRELCSGSMIVSANANQIQQIVINLCTNALDATPRGGSVTVVCRRLLQGQQALARVEVRDTGTGIPAAIRQKIFDPFFTTKEPGKGTGLGLALVYELVGHHHGRLDYASEEGRGTSFFVDIPLCEIAAEAKL